MLRETPCQRPTSVPHLRANALSPLRGCRVSHKPFPGYVDSPRCVPRYVPRYVPRCVTPFPGSLDSLRARACGAHRPPRAAEARTTDGGGGGVADESERTSDETQRTSDETQRTGDDGYARTDQPRGGGQRGRGQGGGGGPALQRRTERPETRTRAAAGGAPWRRPSGMAGGPDSRSGRSARRWRARVRAPTRGGGAKHSP